MKRPKIYLLMAAFLSCAQSAIAQDAATRKEFWESIAPLTKSIYCNKKIPDERQTQNGFSIEHVYPRSWMKTTLGCGKCKGNKNYISFENDMHNIWPAVRSINSARSNRAFFNLTKVDDRSIDDCRYRSGGVAVDQPIPTEGSFEPRDEVKGDIARAILYVHEAYGGLLPEGELQQMLLWAQLDPVSPEECARNDAINKIQGTSNQFILCLNQ